MIHIGMDGADVVGSFNTQIKTDRSGKAYVYAYAVGGAALKTPKALLWMGSGYAATALNTGMNARVGIPGAVIASGCVGWFQIRGFCSDVQGAATSFSGSFGHAVYWGGATGLGASASAWVNVPSQVAVLAEDVGGGGSTTANLWLVGDVKTSI